MQPSRVVGSAFGLRPLFKHQWCLAMQHLHLLCCTCVSSQFDAVAVGVKEVYLFEYTVIDGSEYVQALTFDVGLGFKECV